METYEPHGSTRPVKDRPVHEYQTLHAHMCAYVYTYCIRIVCHISATTIYSHRRILTCIAQLPRLFAFQT